VFGDVYHLQLRKLSEPLEKEHVAMLQTECDALLSSICQLEQYAKLCESSFSYAMRKHDSVIGSASSAWYIFFQFFLISEV
jgi:hypothetical protein